MILWFSDVTTRRIFVPKEYWGMINLVLYMSVYIFPRVLQIETPFLKKKYVWVSEIGENCCYILGIICIKVIAAALSMIKTKKENAQVE